MDEIKIFSNTKFGEIRTIQSEKGTPLLHATDVAKALGYENPNEAIVINCKSGNIDRIYVAHSNGIGGVNMMFIPETEVYRLIVKSKNTEAEKFQDWVVKMFFLFRHIGVKSDNQH
ncbi:MAG TPA: BRO family protein [Prolixibacteraceae bacterium]|nr:BRO family protein [Prolixibacteraceae bacterium]